MFNSTGVDNLELRLAATWDELNALMNLCLYKSKDEKSYILLNDLKDPKIFLRFEAGKVFANLNVSKLTFEHNVRLAGPVQIATAIRVLEQNTNHVAPRLNWQRADVSLLHVTYT